MTLLLVDDRPESAALAEALGPDTQLVATLTEAGDFLLPGSAPETVVLGPAVDAAAAHTLASRLRVAQPWTGVLLLRGSVDTTVLSDALRAGVREVVPTGELPTLLEAVQRSRALTDALRGATAPAAGAAGRGTVITVFSAKGGCGKTTFATNLGAALADGGRRRVCVLDLDLAFGDVAITLQQFPSRSVADAVVFGDRIDADALAGLVTPHSPGLDTLVAPDDPALADSVPAATVTALLRAMRQSYDVVVVDSPPAFTDQVLAAFDESDLLALMATLDVPALKNLKLTVETLALLSYPRERWRVILNRADSKVGLEPREVEKTLGIPVALQIPSSRDVPSSVNRGIPLVLDQPRHPVSLAVRSFGEREVPTAGTASSAAVAGVPEGLRTDRRGFLRRKVAP